MRRARAGETLETLDGTQRELVPDDLVIADARAPDRIAGVMGGANTEVSEHDDVGAARGGELRAADRAAQRRASPHAHREPDAVGERRRPGARGRRGDVRVAAARRARGRALDRRGRGARRLPARRRRSPSVPRTADGRARARVRRGGAARPAGAARLRRRRTTGRCRRRRWRARDVRRDIDLVEEVARFRLEDVPATLPVRQAMFGRLTHDAAPAPAGRGRARRRRAVRGVHVLAAAGRSRPAARSCCRCRSRSQQRVLRTTLRLGLLDAARHNVAMGNGDVELFEVAHVYLPAAPACPTSAGVSAASSRASFFGREGHRRARSSRRCTSSRASRPRGRSPRLPVGASVQSGWVAQYAPLDLDGEWSAFELDLGRAVRARARADPLPRRDHVPAAAARSRLRRRRGRAGRRAARRRTRRGGRRAARGAVPERLPRRPDPGRQEVGRARVRVPVARAHAVRRGRRAAARRDRAQRWPKRSAPSCAPRRRAVRARRSARRRRESPTRCS